MFLYASDLLSEILETSLVLTLASFLYALRGDTLSLSLSGVSTFSGTSYLDLARYSLSVVEPDIALVPVIWSEPFDVVTSQSAICAEGVPSSAFRTTISDVIFEFVTVLGSELKLDTGMGRLGILAVDAPRVIREVVQTCPDLDCEGIFSHCPTAYDPADEFANDQIALFKAILKDVAKDGITFRKIHIAASDAINNFPAAKRAPFNIVRTGINLHGSFDPNGRRALKVESVLTLKTRVAQVRLLPAGTTLGYGRTWCLARPTRVATISAGYADGLPLALTNRGHVLINGAPCPVIGRISMDYTTVDVSKAGEVKPGDEVIALGGKGKYAITPDDWASLKGTHAYDIICSFGNRVERVYRKS